MSVVQVKNAFKEYHSNSETKVVLKDFNMNVNQGAIYALMGSSGCGKTTLISCIVGVMELDEGSVTIFGEPSLQNRARIGYMPQETALVNEFTVREMISFYGKIYGLSSDKIDERFSFLSGLLELPPEDRLIVDCSGGQQRRISFALTLVHEPEMLILDEPTVGVDPLLRAKIWDYLVDLTKTKNVTVLLSTHYIEEAKQSTHVGLMRNGVQVAEDSPQNILRTWETTSLEEAFLKICVRQENDLDSTDFGDIVKLQGAASRRKSSVMSLLTSAKNVSRKATVRKQTNKIILKALITKNFIHVLRSYLLMAIVIVVPVICIVGVHYGIGGRIKDMKIGFVNDDADFIEHCANRSLITTEIDQENRCSLSRISCRFIDEFDDGFAEKILYKNYDDAYRDAKKGNTVGFIYFTRNYSKATDDFLGGNLEYSDDAIIQVHLDQTDFQKTTFIRVELLDTFERYTVKLLKDCGRSNRAGKIGIFNFTAAHGEFGFNLRKTVAPGFVVSGAFLFSAYLLSVAIISDRLDGNWNRIIVAGAEPRHFVMSHLVEGTFLMAIILFEYSVYAIFFLSPGLSIVSSVYIVALLLFVSLSGLLFGLLFSIVMNSTKASMLFTLFSAYPATFISGIGWPLEAIVPKALQYFSLSLPFTLPVTAYRNIISKGSTLSDPSVYYAFMVLSFWIIGQLLLSFLLIHKEKGVNKKQKQ